jgi:hypothetical protein
MIEMLRIYSNGFLENVMIEELPPDPYVKEPTLVNIRDFGMKVVEGILRMDGESQKGVEKRCQEYGGNL